MAYFQKHGQYGTRLYRTWANMKQRCLNPSRPDYKHYGARGIKVCDEWMEFKNFADWAMQHGYSDNLTLDRIDVNQGYNPSNCRWVNLKVQENNRSNNILIAFNGVVHTRQEWSEITGIKYTTIRNRLDNLHWPIAKALTVGAKGECG